MLASTPSAEAFTFAEFEKMFAGAGFANSEAVPVEGGADDSRECVARLGSGESRHQACGVVSSPKNAPSKAMGPKANPFQMFSVSPLQRELRLHLTLQNLDRLLDLAIMA